MDRSEVRVSVVFLFFFVLSCAVFICCKLIFNGDMVEFVSNLKTLFEKESSFCNGERW